MTDMQTEEPGLGHNRPPQSTVLDRADEIIAVANKWITERPVIADQEVADKAAAFLRQSTVAVKAIEDARLAANKPLREVIAQNDALHNDKSSLLKRLTATISQRLNDYATKARLEQERIAREAAERAAEAKRIADEAAAKEAELLRAAQTGEAQGTFANVAATIQESREAQQLAKQAQAESAAAAKAKPKFGGEHFTDGTRRSLSQRTVEVPAIDKPGDVLRAVGMTDGIRDALLTAARAYKREKGKWPKGVTITTETKVQ